ncbi:MAG: acyl-CoA carboxylase subunit beta [Chloroherpetonaceae bacterium]|nr:acyl-CoA carboxylase subunit beta [Chloroherpetonaceae bacterium]
MHSQTSEVHHTLPHPPEFYRREDLLKTLLQKLSHESSIVKLGGGEKALKKMKEKGKLPARERIKLLLDTDSEFLEIGLFAAKGMYEAEGGCPSAGVVVGIGKIHGKWVMIVAGDATVKAGAWFPMTAKKNMRAQEIAMENWLPVIYLVDSAGVFLPMQDEIFPDKEHFGRQFRNNAKLSAMGIPQIAAVMGSCVAGGAYLPIMCDESLIVDGTGSIFLAGSHLVKAAIGEVIDNETLGGATTQTEISGNIDYKVPTDEACIEKIRELVSHFPKPQSAGFTRLKARSPKYPPDELLGILPEDRAKPYDMMGVLERICDEDSITEFKSSYGKTIITAYARINGWAVGIVANQRLVVKNAKGEVQIGGVIYSDSADKAARFIMNCNQRKIPLLFLQDVTGFMVGSRAEHGGIIKDGAKLVNAISNTVVPKITIIVGNSYGAGNYAMCGKAYDPRFIFAWPTAQIAVMGGKQASETLLSIKLGQLEKKGQSIGEEEKGKFLREISARYESQMNPMYGASKLWIDGIIDPRETRKIVAECLEIADMNPEIPPFRVGVLQT